MEPALQARRQVIIPSCGRIVHYSLTKEDAHHVNRRRVAMTSEPTWVPGSQAHVGNPAHEGDVVPLLVVRSWNHGVNGQAFLDGNDVLWITSAREDSRPRVESHEPGRWRWPNRES